MMFQRPRQPTPPERRSVRRRSKGQFIFDDQTHFIRDDFQYEELLGLGQYAGNGLAKLFVREVVNVDSHGLPLAIPVTPGSSGTRR